jgi:hypothetical protein
MKSLLLDVTAWDLIADAAGNIAVASDPYSQAQDAASAIRLFFGELWYDTTLGVPYWQSILGKAPNVPYMKARFVAAALTVPGVVSATCFISSISGRKVTGQVQITNTLGQTAAAAF